MAIKNYTTKTAALKASIADINKLDAKKMLLNGKNILDYISDSEFNSYDSRDPQLKNDELDIWNTEISLSDNGHIEVKPHAHYMLVDFDTGELTLEGITQSQIETLGTAVKVIDNEVLGENDEHIMYWQTDGLTDGTEMFYECSSLRLFSSGLSSLTNGTAMFYGCYDFNSFTSDLSSLTTGEYMFNGCNNLASFTSDLSSLTNGNCMFRQCHELTSFTSDLSSLTTGEYMFNGCNNLASFTSDLSSLMNGNSMFDVCKLDAPSVANIIHFIPQRDAKPTSTTDDGNILIGIGITNTDAARQAFAEECDCDTWEELNKEFDDKNWAVQWQFNGEATTFDLRAERPSTAVYARLEEVFMPTQEEIAAAKEKGERIETPHYEYTSQDGSKFYNIHWYHDSNTDNEGYDYFESLEEAISAYVVLPKD